MLNLRKDSLMWADQSTTEPFPRKTPEMLKAYVGFFRLLEKMLMLLTMFKAYPASFLVL